MTQSLPLLRRCVVLGALALLSVVAPAAWGDDKPAAADAPGKATADAVDAMLKGMNYFYQRIDTPGQPTMFKIMLQDNQNHSSVIILKIFTWNWKYKDGTLADSIYVYNQLLTTPKLSSAVGAKVAEYNDTLTINACCINADYGLFLYSGFFARGLDGETLSTYLSNLFWTGQSVLEQVNPIIKAEAAEK